MCPPVSDHGIYRPLLCLSRLARHVEIHSSAVQPAPDTGSAPPVPSGFVNQPVVLLLIAVYAANGTLFRAVSRSEKLQAAINCVAASGGGVISLAPRQRVVVSKRHRRGADVTPSLNSGELKAWLTGSNAAGVRMLSRAAVRTGTVMVGHSDSKALRWGRMPASSSARPTASTQRQHVCCASRARPGGRFAKSPCRGTRFLGGRNDALRRGNPSDKRGVGGDRERHGVRQEAVWWAGPSSTGVRSARLAGATSPAAAVFHAEGEFTTLVRSSSVVPLVAASRVLHASSISASAFACRARNDVSVGTLTSLQRRAQGSATPKPM